MPKVTSTREQRKETFRKIGAAISRKDLLQGYDGRYQFEVKPMVSQDNETRAFRGQLGRSAPRMKVTQFLRTRVK